MCVIVMYWQASESPWAARTQPRVLVFNGNFVVLGGLLENSVAAADVWYTTGNVRLSLVVTAPHLTPPPPPFHTLVAQPC